MMAYLSQGQLLHLVAGPMVKGGVIVSTTRFLANLHSLHILQLLKEIVIFFSKVNLFLF